MMIYWYFFFNDTATTEIYTLSLHDALPISSDLFARIDSLRERYNMFRQQNKYRSASALNDTLKIVEERYEQEKKQFLSAHDDLIAAYMVQMDAMKSDMDIEGLRRLYDSLGEGAKNTLSARIMKERIDRLEKTRSEERRVGKEC